MSLGAEFESAVNAIAWSDLRSTYGTGEVIRDVIMRLASGDHTQTVKALETIRETVLQHQNTVYPATVAAAPFLCQIALAPEALFRSALVSDLPFLALGSDAPYSPAGTALDVRNGIRSYVEALFDLWDREAGLDFALVALAVAFPVEAGMLSGRIRAWFEVENDDGVRLGLAICLRYLGIREQQIEDLVRTEVGKELRWATVTEDFVIHSANTTDGPGASEEPYLESAMANAIRAADRRRAAGRTVEPDDLFDVFEVVLAVLGAGYKLIDYPS